MALNDSDQFKFDNTYSKLPEHFFARLDPTPVLRPNIIKVNHSLARHLGLDPDFLETPTGANILVGNQVPDGAEPLAMAYSGHQFGGWVPQLGDGRAILLGEIIGSDGQRNDIHLKGAGRTPFSRSGDGRAWIGPVLREYILSEAMAALSIPTTRALAVTSTGETVMRDSGFPGAVLARVASSHIRVGTFQFFSARKDINALRTLSDHVIDRHFPEVKSTSNKFPENKADNSSFFIFEKFIYKKFNFREIKLKKFLNDIFKGFLIFYFTLVLFWIDTHPNIFLLPFKFFYEWAFSDLWRGYFYILVLSLIHI